MKQIYLDADDDITAIINKLETINAERIALIPPKRSTALQSVVNLKLLKKASAAHDNELVLITRDPVVTNVASQLGLLTAPNLETEPAVPQPKDTEPVPSDTIDGSKATDRDLSQADQAAGALEDEEKGKPKKEKKPKKGRSVPDFGRFKKRILLAVLALLLLGFGLWAALVWLPQADISIEGLTQDVSADFSFQVDPNAEGSDFQARMVAGEAQQESRTLSTDFEATGSETRGERATGQVTVTNCESSSAITIGSGTALTAANGRVFRATENVSVPGSSAASGFTCAEDGQATVPVQADDIGSEYNLGPTSYTVNGYDAGNVYGSGSNMSGGEREEVTIVTSEDIEQARQSLLEGERADAEGDLRERFAEELFIIDASFSDDVTETTSQPPAGEEASQATLILEVSYSLLAVEEEAMDELLETVYAEENDTETESLGMIESGLDDADITATDESEVFQLASHGVLGPDIDEDELRAEIGGMRYTEAVDTIEDKPNVTNVVIDLSPLWVGSVPSNPEKIDIQFEISDADADDSGD